MQQEQALKEFDKWFFQKRGRKQVFRLFGYAGTGKTTLALEFAQRPKGQVQFGAFTGKAAHVMHQKGCKGARTIHSLIYSPVEGEDGSVYFIKNEQSDISKADLVIIDECSMVGTELGNDLLSFGVPILVLGDPAQLPPVKDAGFFTEHEPDVMLTEIHRQARDNPIIALATDVREGKTLKPGEYGTSAIINRRPTRNEIMYADQVLCGMNRTRHTVNHKIRVIMGHHVDGLPCPREGDRLVCLKNNREKKLLNGSLWECKEIIERTQHNVRMLVTPEDEDAGKGIEVFVPLAWFRGKEDEIPENIKKSTEAFDFGYVLTTHKAQGSQWDRVAIFDESHVFRDKAARWLYTAITRAAHSMTIIRD